MNDQTPILMTIEYDGTDLVGWARQPSARSVEQALYDACASIGITTSTLICSGRTDAGVHAEAQGVSTDYAGTIPPDRLAAALNTELDPDITIHNVEVVPEGFNAREHAVSRTYTYTIDTHRWARPTMRRRALHHRRPLDMTSLAKCADALIGDHDFTAFTPTKTQHTHFRREMLDARWEHAGGTLTFTITGAAFLRHMVRSLVGTMLAVGRGERTTREFAQLLSGADRSEADMTIAAQGLTLVDVAYPEFSIRSRIR